MRLRIPPSTRRLLRGVLLLAGMFQRLGRLIIILLRRHAWDSMRMMLALLMIYAAARLLFLPDPLDQQRAAHRLLLSGDIQRSYSSYFELYAAGARNPELLLRLAEARLLRGEAPEAELLLAQALLGPLAPAQLGEAQLAYGWSLALQGRQERATSVWENVAVEYQARAALLRGEAALLRGDIAEALQATEQAQAGALPAEWRALATYREALLKAADDPQSAATALERFHGEQRGTWLLLPLGSWPASLWHDRVDRLRRGLNNVPAQRSLILAGLLAEEGLPSSAQALLQRVPQEQRSEQELLFIAQLHSQQGDHQGAIDTLIGASARHPRSTALLRLVALLQAEQDQAAAKATLEQIEALVPAEPDNALVEAAIKRAERDYIAAAAAYDQAITLATADRRPHYHLHAARFYYDTAWKQCDEGVRHARLAAEGVPDQPDASVLLGELLLRCGSFNQALEIGDSLVAGWPDEPAGHYIRGAALQGLGRHETGEQALVRAANLAPASSWRARAEAQLID